MRRVVKERIAAAVVIVAALMLLLVGAARSHKVYESGGEEFGLLPFTRVSDAALVIDATFSGVKRDGARLYSTYDRSEARGKRSCPT